MVSPINLQEKYNKVRQSFCFYLDIQDPGLSRSISRRLQDMGLREEVFLTPSVTHVVASRVAPSVRSASRCARREGRARADAMLQRLRPEPQPAPPLTHAYVHLTVHKAISLLDKLYDTFFTAPRKSHVRLFNKHFIKIEFLDKLCRPVFKEFDEWPHISLEPDPPKEKKEKKDLVENLTNTIKNTPGQKMTRKSRPRIKDKEEKEPKGGYCEMCNTDYVDAAIHRRSPQHIAFVRDHTNFIALDTLISSGADVSTFLDKATPVNGERRSLRKLCNGDSEPKNKRSKRSQSPDSTMNDKSPKRNGGLDEVTKRSTRCSKRSSESQISEGRQYYKVVGVSTKLRSSGGFATKRKGSPTACNGTKPLVVKFRKVRRSELSVLSDEAEQFMFPKRASSTSSTSSEEHDSEGDDSKERLRPKRKTPPQPQTLNDRQRLARPVALKEESSEEESWPQPHRKRKKRTSVSTKRGRRLQYKSPAVDPPPKPPEPKQASPPETAEPQKQPEAEISPLREELSEKCMKWEDGRLKYTPAVENLEFAFESVPHSEPWFETFKRQDQDKVLIKNLPQYFALYSRSPKLPYEIGQLPSLKSKCPLSDIAKQEEKPGPSRSYGTRGMKKQKIKKRTLALMALEHPRKSPREHASTLAILGSAGLLHRRKHAEDAKSTASEDTISDTHSNTKVEPIQSDNQEASERMQQFLSEVYEDAADYDVPDDVMEGDTTVTTFSNIPDVSSLVSECENCDIIRNEIKQNSNTEVKSKKGKFKKKNKTGWPSKRKQVRKDSRNSSMETEKPESLDTSSIEPPDDETTQDTILEDHSLSETEKNVTVIENTAKSDNELEERKTSKAEEKECKRTSRSSASETEEKDKNKKKRTQLAIGDWLQPIVRVSRMEPNSARRLRSAGRVRVNRTR
ncbi:Protein chiffon [Papilio xuthus]|uniref:Protein chiffon n=1 Tax=Papilio xuthus TaxID=66420 RepID=A0A194PQN5_PAPXU|nr:Protein chiffon [Papilio xuthus]